MDEARADFRDGKLRLRLLAFVPFHVHSRRQCSVTGPAIHTKVKVTYVDDRDVGVGRGKNWARFTMKLGKQGTTGRGGKWEVSFFTWPRPFTGHHCSIDVHTIAGFEI